MKYKIEPYQWQHKLIGMVVNGHDEVAVLADMGTGKTGGVINCLRVVYGKAGRVKRTVIISPLVTLFNWKNEFVNHSYILPHNVHVLHGSSDKKLKIFEAATANDPNQIIIMNYETALSDKVIKALLKWKAEVIVLDESHYVKNHKAKRSKVIEDLASKCSHRFIMSGTPMTNSLTDIFMQYKILDGGKTFGTNFYSFQRKYMEDANSAWSHKLNHFPKWVPRECMLKELQDKIYSKAIRVTKDECMDLPPRIQQVYPVELSAKQMKYYKSMLDDYVTFVEENEAKGISVATTALTKALRLQQIVTGYAKLDDGTELVIEDNPRIDALEELVDTITNNGHKVIVWCAFKNNYVQINKMLEAMKLKYVNITGEESLAQKEENMNIFNKSSDVNVAVCNRKAAGIGVNLVAAKYTITYSRNYSLEQELQSADRNYRGGSQIHDSIVKIDLCAKGTVDEVVTEALVNKKNIADKVIEIAKQQRG